MKLLLMTVLTAMLLTGCATQRTAQEEPDAAAGQDAKMTRGLMDSMASAPHRFPANLPR